MSITDEDSSVELNQGTGDEESNIGQYEKTEYNCLLTWMVLPRHQPPINCSI